MKEQFITADPVRLNKDSRNYTKAIKLSQGDVVTVDFESAMQGFDILFNKKIFTLCKIYKKRIIPSSWRKKLKIWQWAKKKVYFDFEFIGGQTYGTNQKA